MSVVEFLSELRKLGVHIALDGDRLRLSAPIGALTDAHRRGLQQRKTEIVEFLRSAQQLATQQRAIVPLTPSGERPPIFAVAGHNGDVFCYRALAEQLGNDQPFFGLQPPGLEEGTEPVQRVEELAAYFAKQIREFMPQGPYTIAGFCAGGTIAFELARQLNDAAASVMNLVLFGAPYPTSYRKLPQMLATGTYFVRRSLVHAKTLLTMRPDERARYFQNRVRALQPVKEEPPSDPVIMRRLRVEEATMSAVRAYDPGSFAGHIDLMLPCRTWKRSWDMPLRWQRRAISSAEFVGPDDCNGDTMLREKYAGTFAELLAGAQDRHSRERLNEGREGTHRSSSVEDARQTAFP